MGLVPCTVCNTSEYIEVEETEFFRDFYVYCSNCYDAECVGDPPRYVCTSRQKSGKTKEEAIENWNEDD